MLAQALRPVCAGRRSHIRRGGRAVEYTGLENRHTRKGIGGSNPSLSASFLPSKSIQRRELQSIGPIHHITDLLDVAGFLGVT